MRHNAASRRVILIAHRGASAEAPESTRAALRRALAAKVEMIELDVQLTRDRRLVIFHDAQLQRTTNGRGRLSAWRYRDLSRLDAGSWFSPRFSGQRVLLVSQALRAIPAPCRINLELKRTTQRTTLVRTLLRCLEGTRSQRRVLLSSFDPSLLARAQAARPRLARALLCARHPLAALRNAVSLGCVAWHPHQSLVTRPLVNRAHAAGLRVHVWTVDRATEARRLLAMGVDGLFTNDPARLRALLRAQALS